MSVNIRAILHAALICCAVSSEPASAAGPFGSIRVGAWSGGAFTNDRTGEFNGCIATAPYKSGITMVVMVTPKMTWNLGFTRSSWNNQVNSTFPIVLTFDGQQPFNVTGVALTSDTVGVPMPIDSALIRQFRAAKRMSAFAEGTLFQFSLDHTSVLLPALVRCVSIVNRDGLGAVGNFVVTPSRPGPEAKATPMAPAAGSSLRPDAGGASNPDLQIEALELASNFILNASLKNAKVLRGHFLD